MTYHYHAIECPHCNKQLQRRCNLDNCTTATVSLEPFISSDGYKAEAILCPRRSGVTEHRGRASLAQRRPDIPRLRRAGPRGAGAGVGDGPR